MFRFASGLRGKIENFVTNLPVFFQFFWTNSGRERKCVNLLFENPSYFQIIVSGSVWVNLAKIMGAFVGIFDDILLM